MLGLLGPNGSGKTTTMKAIAGVVSADGGIVSIDGIDALEEHGRAMRCVGCLIETPALYEYMSAYKNLMQAARFYPDADEARIDETLDLVDMARFKKERVSSFSLGMRQRLALALALLSRPSLLILDEPVNGLDIQGIVDVRNIVQRLAAGGAAILISSHLAHELEQCCTKVGIMQDGALLEVAHMEDVAASSPSLEDYYLAVVSAKRGYIR